MSRTLVLSACWQQAVRFGAEVKWRSALSLMGSGRGRASHQWRALEVLAVAVLLVAALSSAALASHYRGASASYMVSDAGLLTVDVFSLWRSDFVSGPSFQLRTGPGGAGTLVANLSLTSSVNPYSTGTELGGASFLVRRDTFTFDMSSLAPGTYYAWWSNCCRVAGINNAPESSWSVQLTIKYNGVGAGLGNSGPSILPATIDVIGRGVAYMQTLNSVDPDGTPVNVQFLGGTLGGGSASPNFGPTADIPGIALDSSTGTVSISAANTASLALGRWVYKVRVTDGSGATAERDVLVLVQELLGNTQPGLSPIGPKVVAVNTPLSFNVSATDADSGQMLTLRARLLPAGASFPDATATSPAVASSTFSWTPTNGQEGVHKVFFEVFDNASTPLIASELIEITVTGANDPPVLDPIGNRSVANGGTLTFAISGSDPDIGQTLSYSAFFLPPGATFTPGTRTFNWTPSPAQYDSVFTGVTFRVTDDAVPPLFDEEAVSITVGAGNQSPAIGVVPPQTVAVGQLLQVAVTATDPNLTQTLSLTSLGTLPPGATFSPASGTSPISSILSWTPSAADVGTHTVQFRVEDSGTPILSATRSVSITVIAVPPTSTPTSTPTPTPTATPTSTPTATPTATPTSTPTSTPTATPTSTPTWTPTPTPTPGTAILTRTYLYLGRANGSHNGKLILRMSVDDPFHTLANNLLLDGVSVATYDAGNSWQTSRILTGCVQRSATRVVCRPNRELRAVFKRVRNSTDQWSMLLFVRGLSDAETGATNPAGNPIEPPVSIRFENGADLSVGQTSACGAKRHFALVCKVP